MHRGAGKRFASAGVAFPIQPPFEGLGLLPVKLLEVLVPSGLFETGNGLRYLIDRLFIPTLRFLQIVEIFALDPGVCGIVLWHCSSSLGIVTVWGRMRPRIYA
jgi:hypothetical protein